MLDRPFAARRPLHDIRRGVGSGLTFQQPRLFTPCSPHPVRTEQRWMSHPVRERVGFWRTRSGSGPWCTGERRRVSAPALNASGSTGSRRLPPAGRRAARSRQEAGRARARAGVRASRSSRTSGRRAQTRGGRAPGELVSSDPLGRFGVTILMVEPHHLNFVIEAGVRPVVALITSAAPWPEGTPAEMQPTPR